MKNRLERLIIKNNKCLDELSRSVLSKYVTSEYITKSKGCRYYLVYYKCSYMSNSLKAIVFRIESNGLSFSVLKDTLIILSSRYEAEVFKADFKNKIKAEAKC